MIPRTIEHIIRYKVYPVGEPIFEQVIEQIRFRVRENDIEKAVADISTIFQADFSTVAIPENDHDWSAKINDECFVDSWVLAKLVSVNGDKNL